MKSKIIGLCAACLASGMGFGLIVQLNERPGTSILAYDIQSEVEIILRECSLTPSSILRAMGEFVATASGAGLNKNQADIRFRESIASEDDISWTGAELDCWQAVLDSEYGR